MSNEFVINLVNDDVQTIHLFEDDVKHNTLCGESVRHNTTARNIRLCKKCHNLAWLAWNDVVNQQIIEAKEVLDGVQPGQYAGGEDPTEFQVSHSGPEE
jgi:hypothetical protein